MDDRPSDGSFPSAPPDDWPATLPGRVESTGAPGGPGRRSSPLTDALPVLAVAVAFALVITLGLGWALGRENRTVVRVEDTQDTTPPASSSVPTPTTTQPGLSSDFADLVAFVERARGRRFQTAPSIGGVSDTDFARTAARQLDTIGSALDTAVARYEALGLVANGDWSTPLGARLGTRPALLDVAQSRVVVRNVALLRDDAYDRADVVRQLARLLDAQVFRLAAPMASDIGDEATFARKALLAGSAERIVGAYEQTLTAPERSALAGRRNAVTSALGSVANASLLTVDAFPTTLGTPLVEGLVAARGVSVLDAAFGAPPRQSAGMLAGSLAAGPAPRAVSAPLASGPLLAQGSFGAADLALLLGLRTAATAAPIGTHWGGARYVVWRGSTRRPCIRIRLVGRDPAGTAFLASAVSTWARAKQATVEEAPEPGSPDGHGVLQITRCVA